MNHSEENKEDHVKLGNYETSFYTLVIVKRDNEDMYGILNRKTKIVEYATQELPDAVEQLMGLQDDLIKTNQIFLRYIN